MSTAKIHEYLRANPDTPYTAKELAVACGISTRGTQVLVRQLCTELMSQGVPLIADDEGFQYTENPVKHESYIRTLEQRKDGIDAKIRYVKRTLGRLQGQIQGLPCTRDFCDCGMTLTYADTDNKCRFCRARIMVQKRTAPHTASYSGMLYENHTDTDTATIPAH